MSEPRSPSIASGDDPLYEVISHLAVAMQQSFRIDDDLTVDHIEAAHRIALELYRKGQADKERADA